MPPLPSEATNRIRSADRPAAVKRLSAYRNRRISPPKTARDGKSGLALAAEACPDLALIDIALPDMDGYEVAHRLRTSNGDRRIDLIAIGGFGRRGTNSAPTKLGLMPT